MSEVPLYLKHTEDGDGNKPPWGTVVRAQRGWRGLEPARAGRACS